jgi:leukotriene A-4 hydrolase/aminopeptidase
MTPSSRVLGFALVFGSALVAQQPATTKPSPETIDVHSYARPGEARVKHVGFDWNVDFAKKEIRGAARYLLERAPGSKEIVLDTRDLVIEKAEALTGPTLTPSPTTFKLGPKDPILGAPLTVALPPDAAEIRIFYRTSPSATGLQWLAPEQTATKTHPYLFSQAQAIHARSFIPIQDSPGQRVTWDAMVSVPKGMTPVMSAERMEMSGRWLFTMLNPVPPYLIAIAVGNLEFRQIGPRTGVWSEPGVVERAASEFADLEKMVEAVEAKFGDYRWDRYDVLVLPPSFPFGGMENPMMTFATPTLLAGDRSLVAVIAHELAHSWSGNLVTNATWRDFWLNEGFTVYLEGRIIESLYGERVATQHRILGRNDLREELDGFKDKPGETVLYIDLKGRDPDDGMTSVPYQKGSLFLEMLEHAVGRDRFDPFLKTWFTYHAFQPVTTPQFEQFIREYLFPKEPAAMDRLKVREWLYGPGLPDNAPTYDESVFDAPAKAAADLAAGSREARALGAEKWTTNDWLHFLQKLPGALPAAKLAELDASWKLTTSGNAEIAAAWFKLAIASKYDAANERIEKFLLTVGRRKFLKPLYAEMAKTPEGLARAREIYRKARPGYHAIATQTLDKMLGEPESRPAAPK